MANNEQDYSQLVDLFSDILTTLGAQPSGESVIISQNIQTDATSEIKVPSVKAAKTYVDNSIPIVPTNISSFNNDSGYLTSHQDISGKFNTSDISNAISTDASSTTKVPSVKAIKDYIDDLPDSELSNNSPRPVKNSTIYNALEQKFNTSNVSNNMSTDGSSATKVPTCKSIKKYVDDSIPAVSNAISTDASSTTKVPSVNAIKSYVDTSVSNGASVTTGSFTLNSSLTGATIGFSSIKQIGDIVYISLTMDLGTTIGSSNKLLGTISGVANPAATTAMVPCFTKPSGTNDTHLAFATIGIGAIAVKSTDSNDEYVYIETCYQAATT